MTTTTAPARFPLSPQQARIWECGRDHPGLVAQAIVTITGPLDEPRLMTAAQSVFRRYEILRTAIVADANGVPMQVVGEGVAPSLRRVDVPTPSADALACLLRDERSRPSDGDRDGYPRLALARLGADAHALIVTLPASHGDARSVVILVDELAAEYERPTVAEGGGPARLQHGDLTLWRNDAAPEQAGRDFWRHHTTGSAFDPGIALLGSSVSPRFDPDRLVTTLASEAIDTLVATHGGTSQSWLALCWHLALARLAGGGPVVVGTRFDGRPYPELADAVGPLAADLPLRCALNPDEAATDALTRLHGLLTEASDWQECFAWGTAPDGAAPAIAASFEFVEEQSLRAAGDCTFEITDSYFSPDRFRMRLTCRRRGPELRLELYYDSTALGHADAASVLAQVVALVRGVAASPLAPLGTLRTADQAESQAPAVAINDTPGVDTPPRGVSELVAEHARATPHEAALEIDGTRMTYAQLDASANRLAHALVRRGVDRGSYVGVCLERSLDLVVALLAVLKAGGAYVPIDVTHPPARARFMLSDTQAAVVLTQISLKDRVPDGGDVIVLDAQRDAIAAESSAAPPVRPDLSDPAYVIYTSGSTGTPKGVVVTHEAFANYVGWATRAYAIASGSGAPVHSPIGFDLTITSLWGTLAAGRTVVLIPEAEGLDGLAAALRSRRDFSLVKLTPSQLDVLSELLPAEEAAGCSRAFVVGGEPLATQSIAFWREHAPETRIFNEYGPTEATVGCSVYEVPDGDLPGPRVPIGHSAAGSLLRVLDPHLNPVPVGVPGELYVGGPGVARGYLGRPDLTAERFVPDGFSDEPGARLYRTGDRVRILDGGNLEFLDRVDRQLKIRGFRVEPEELERALAEHETVDRAVAVVRDGPGGPSLVAYCARRRGASVSDVELMASLSATLPGFMLPADIIVLDALPLTVNGKVDLAALPAAAPARQRYVAPRDPLEQVLAGIWADVLETDELGIHDSFFDLGGQSMSAARMVFLIRDALQIELPLRTVFEAPTIAALASAIGADPVHGPPATASARILIEVAAMTDDEVRAAVAPETLGAT
jgi:amino acid adenylation domain-containing protein